MSSRSYKHPDPSGVKGGEIHYLQEEGTSGVATTGAAGLVDAAPAAARVLPNPAAPFSYDDYGPNFKDQVRSVQQPPQGSGKPKPPPQGQPRDPQPREPAHAQEEKRAGLARSVS